MSALVRCGLLLQRLWLACSACSAKDDNTANAAFRHTRRQRDPIKPPPTTIVRSAPACKMQNTHTRDVFVSECIFAPDAVRHSALHAPAPFPAACIIVPHAGMSCVWAMVVARRASVGWPSHSGLTLNAARALCHRVSAPAGSRVSPL